MRLLLFQRVSCTCHQFNSSKAAGDRGVGNFVQLLIPPPPVLLLGFSVRLCRTEELAAQLEKPS